MVLGIGFLLVILGFFVVMPADQPAFVDQLGWAAGVWSDWHWGCVPPSRAGVFGSSLADKFRGAPSSSAACCCGRWGFASLASCPERIGTDHLSCIISGLGGCCSIPCAALVIKIHPATGAGSATSPC